MLRLAPFPMARKESDTEEVRAKLKDVNSEYYYHKDYQLGATENDENFRKALGNYLGLLPRPRDANRKFLDKRRAEGLSELQQLFEDVPFEGHRSEFCAITDKNCYNRLMETSQPKGPAHYRGIVRAQERDPA